MSAIEITMPTFTVTHDDTVWGAYSGATAEEALLACLRDNDPTRPRTASLLSTSADYGRRSGGHRTDGWGNGAHDRSRYWFVDGGEAGFGVFEVADVSEDA